MLVNDTYIVGELELSQVLLMNNTYFPWIVLVPRGQGLVELYDLGQQQQEQLIKEITLLSKRLKTLTNCDKINVASLGNKVSQLHVHIIARFKHDIAWPNPVWGSKTQPYNNDLIIEVIKNYRAGLLFL